MEAQGGTLGLNGSAALTNNVADNVNLDIHMEKNTEYGAMAILSASSYGNPNVIPNGGTTTGNKSGVYMYLNGEWVAGNAVNPYADAELNSFKTASLKYFNHYKYDSKNEIAMQGDATLETKGWHGNGKSEWICNEYRSAFSRAVDKSIFSYSGYQNNSYTPSPSYTPGDTSVTHYSRAVVVVGERILVLNCKLI